MCVCVFWFGLGAGVGRSLLGLAVDGRLAVDPPTQRVLVKRVLKQRGNNK